MADREAVTVTSRSLGNAMADERRCPACGKTYSNLNFRKHALWHAGRGELIAEVVVGKYGLRWDYRLPKGEVRE